MLSAGSKYLVPDWLPKRLEQSWQRCQGLGLPRNAHTSLEPVAANEVQRILQRDEQLLNVARSELQNLTSALAGTGHVAFVVDDLGFIVTAAGDLQNAGPILGRVQRGVNLSEAVCGTNAAGTVLIEKRPLLVRRSQHYLSELSDLDCFAAPIMAPSGQLLGALTISNSTPTQVPGVAELTQVAIARMEQTLVRQLESPLLIRLHPHIDGLGSAAEGLLAVTTDGEVMGLNSAAAKMLGATASELIGRALESVFECDPLQTLATRSNTVATLRVRGGLGLCALLKRNNAIGIDTSIRIKPCAMRSHASSDLRLVDALSRRELEVLNHLELGLTNQEIARRLFISEDSIKYHLKNVFSKLRAKTRLEAVKVARDLGLLTESVAATPRVQHAS